MPHDNILVVVQIWVTGWRQESRVELEEFIWVGVCPEGKAAHSPDLLEGIMERLDNCCAGEWAFPGEDLQELEIGLPCECLKSR